MGAVWRKTTNTCILIQFNISSNVITAIISNETSNNMRVSKSLHALCFCYCCWRVGGGSQSAHGAVFNIVLTLVAVAVRYMVRHVLVADLYILGANVCVDGVGELQVEVVVVLGQRHLAVVQY